MSEIYKQILAKLEKLPVGNTKEGKAWLQKYLGSDKPTKCVKTGDIIGLAKQIVKENNLNKDNLTKLLDLLYSKAKTYEEIALAASLLSVSPKLKREIDPRRLDDWLSSTCGWAECDVLCQSNFPAEDMLPNWNIWKKLLIKFSKDKNIQKRRASLVLLTKAVRTSTDTRFSDLAFKNIDRLRGEKEILITKAVSWILRSLIKNHKDEVADYLKMNRETLPKIAVREVEMKLATGRKTAIKK